jgi:PPP family 3-phenylpropionic acid transporter
MPYWRLSTFYFFYFAVLGALVPYWGLFLQNRGFSAIEIGQLMAILMATKIVAPNIWGWIGDHLGHRMMIVRVASLLSMIVFAAMYYSDGFWTIAAVMILYSFFWNASLPQFEAVTFTYLKEKVARYARIRAWGSVGFIVTVVVLGVLVDAMGTEVVLSVVMLIFISIWLSSLTVRDPAPEAHSEQQLSLWAVMRKPAILAFFAAVFLMQMSHGPYYAFYSIFMEGHGYSKTLIGQLWALGVLAEVGLFIIMHQLLERWGARKVLIASLMLAAVRWLMIGYLPDSLLMLLIAQLLHAATFGTFHASAIHLVHHYFPGRLQGRGQALYSSVSFGAGGAIGALASGFSWEVWGAGASFALASGIALMGVVIAWRFIDSAHDY